MVVLAAIVPPIIYVLWVRSKELCDRDQLRALLSAFVVGGTFSLGLAFLMESALVTLLFGEGGALSRPFWNLDPGDPSFQLVLMACVMAPLVEEMTKAWGIMLFRGRLAVLKNGLVYGAAVGLGFAAVENVLYGANAIAVGLDVFVGTAVLRALTSTLLHASASAIAGFWDLQADGAEDEGAEGQLAPLLRSGGVAARVVQLLRHRGSGVGFPVRLHARIGLRWCRWWPPPSTAY